MMDERTSCAEHDLADRVARNAPLALAAVKEVLRATPSLNDGDAFERQDELISGQPSSQDAREGAPEEYRPMFEVNVFGLIETTRAALPVLRRSGGTIVNMSSGAGIAGGGGGYYNAAKFAVEGISEALAGELKPFGIRVLIVEPGPFRTDFLGRSIAMAANEMPEYAASSRKHYRETNNGNQAGDPDKAIAVILQAVDADDAPLHLPLGPIAHSIAERKLAAFRSDIDAWRDITIATDFDQP